MEHFTPIENLLEQKSDDMQKNYLSVSRFFGPCRVKKKQEKKSAPTKHAKA